MLSKQFLQKIAGQELMPPLYNATAFVQASGWNTARYFGRWFADTTPYPLLLNLCKDEGVMYITMTKPKRLAEEAFLSYWKDPSYLDIRNKEFSSCAQKIDETYSRYTYEFIRNGNLSAMINDLDNVLSLLWDMNTLGFFTIYLDKEMCRMFLEKSGVSDPDALLELAWEKGIQPVGDSFDRRQLLVFLGLVAEGTSWDRLVEHCQYFQSTYNKIDSLAKTDQALRDRYAGFLEREAAVKKLGKERIATIRRQSEFAEWRKNLTEDGQKLTEYLQTLIEIRDIRKDYIAKILTVLYRLAQRVFHDAGVPEDLILYYRFDELKKGPLYLASHQTDLRRRLHGYTVLVNNEGEFSDEYERFEENAALLEQSFHEQNRQVNLESEGVVIRGQAGSKGSVRGVARIITNLTKQQDSFQAGEVLVTGMTRPEYVPLMKKASAIVTDEGGITCHAAIVSRELKLPCVIGTKNATRILHDGDRVEVDADKGEVRIIN